MAQKVRKVRKVRNVSLGLHRRPETLHITRPPAPSRLRCLNIKSGSSALARQKRQQQHTTHIVKHCSTGDIAPNPVKLSVHMGCHGSKMASCVWHTTVSFRRALTEYTHNEPIIEHNASAERLGHTLRKGGRVTHRVMGMSVCNFEMCTQCGHIRGPSPNALAVGTRHCTEAGCGEDAA